MIEVLLVVVVVVKTGGGRADESWGVASGGSLGVGGRGLGIDPEDCKNFRHFMAVGGIVRVLVTVATARFVTRQEQALEIHEAAQVASSDGTGVVLVNRFESAALIV